MSIDASVIVEREDVVNTASGRLAKASVSASGHTEVLDVLEEAYFGKNPTQVFDRTIRRGIVYENDLFIRIGRIHHALKASLGQEFAVVV
jgi:hypothetical protein